MKAIRFSYHRTETGRTVASDLAYLPITTGKVASFPAVELAFAWTQAATVPLILGQINFFLEFDVCFFRSQSAFEVQPKVSCQ